MQLRLRRRRTSLITDDVQTVMESEFLDRDGNPDLQLSVYEFSNDGIQGLVIQVHCEHAASANADPKGAWHIDVEGCYEKAPSVKPDGFFAFSRQAHRELIFSSKDDLLQFSACLMQNHEARTQIVERNELCDYVSKKLAERDEEWLRYYAERVHNRKKWKKKWKIKVDGID